MGTKRKIEDSGDPQITGPSYAKNAFFENSKINIDDNTIHREETSPDGTKTSPNIIYSQLPTNILN